MGNEQGSVLNREPLQSPCKTSWNASSDGLIGREGHAAASVNNKVYFYGGSGLDHLFELSVFDVEDQKWKDIAVFGENPGPLCNPSLTAIGCKLYLFGGLNRETGWSNDIWIFDTDTAKWTRPAVSGSRPSPRDKHSCVVWGNKLVIFGGFGPAQDDDDDEEEEEEACNFTWFKDVFIFDTGSNTWEALDIESVSAPVARAAHSATCYQDQMIVFGGKDSKARNQDLHVLDLDKKEWKRFEDAGSRPAPTSFHTAVQYKQFMLVYGGRFNDNTHSNQLNVLDCESGGWYSPVEGTVVPPARGQATLTLLPNDTLLMFGGSDKFDPLQQCCQVFHKQAYTMDCTPLQPVEIPEPVPEPMVEESKGGETEIQGVPEIPISSQSENSQIITED